MNVQYGFLEASVREIYNTEVYYGNQLKKNIIINRMLEFIFHKSSAFLIVNGERTFDFSQPLKSFQSNKF